ncbi:MAG TPA: LysR substrate-binding domain-containing protein [Micromonosporaceae bacterium]|nr:LysR substrate-binding domain-containing protein [Micromonosporaceae bacterium]
MELHQLRYVLAVAEAGSFTRAAEALYLAQPSLSVQIRKLERELGVSLFERLGREVTLTSAGEAFLEHARPALFHVRRAREEAVAVRKLERGRIAIGALPSVAATVLPRVLAAYRAAHPDIEVILAERNLSSEFEQMVQAGELDLAVVRVPWRRPSLAGQVLIREPMVAMLPPGHRLSGRQEIDLAELSGDDFVAMPPGSGLRTLLESACQRHGFVPAVTVQTEQLPALCGMVRNGMGVSVVPRLVATGYPVTVALADPRACRELAVVWRSAGQLAPAALVLLDTMLTATRELGVPDAP